MAHARADPAMSVADHIIFASQGAKFAAPAIGILNLCRTVPAVGIEGTFP